MHRSRERVQNEVAREIDSESARSVCGQLQNKASGRRDGGGGGGSGH
jgi:hypothetical protein